MKRFKKEDVFTVLNAADAELYIDTVGFFAESLSDLQKNITEGITDTLRSVDTDNAWCFTSDNDSFPFFLPASKVIKPEKKYRPYKDMTEFYNNVVDLGGAVTIRSKLAKQKEITSMLIAISWNTEQKKNRVLFSGFASYFTFEELLEYWEIYSDCEWKPFGVEE